MYLRVLETIPSLLAHHTKEKGWVGEVLGGISGAMFSLEEGKLGYKLNSKTWNSVLPYKVLFLAKSTSSWALTSQKMGECMGKYMQRNTSLYATTGLEAGVMHYITLSLKYNELLK